VPEINGATNLKLLYQFYKNVHGDNISMLDFKKKLETLCDKFELNKTFLSREVNVGFSGGEKKQVELLHILAVMPKVIFLDEPDSGVDKEAVKKVFSVMKYLSENGAVIVFTSHSNNFFDLNVSKIYEIKDKVCKIK
jgi:Fe-S cluster assembly ATP-binding protein